MQMKYISFKDFIVKNKKHRNIYDVFRVCLNIYMLLSRDLEVERAGAITNCLGSVFFKIFDVTLTTLNNPRFNRVCQNNLLLFVRVSSSNLQLSLHLLHFIVNLEEERLLDQTSAKIHFAS